MKTISFIASIVALCATLVAATGWVVYIHDSNLLVTSVLFLPNITGLAMSILKRRQRLWKAALLYACLSLLFSGLVDYIVWSS
ncbi:MAG: hypothetical protein PHV49_00090 [Alistipes sp.]|nr:hypothetical protein [Alistipes sp.]